MVFFSASQVALLLSKVSSYVNSNSITITKFMSFFKIIKNFSYIQYLTSDLTETKEVRIRTQTKTFRNPQQPAEKTYSTKINVS